MRTIISVTVCAAVVLLLMPEVRHNIAAASDRAGFATTVADYTEDAGRALSKALSALVEDITPSNSNRPPARP